MTSVEPRPHDRSRSDADESRARARALAVATVVVVAVVLAIAAGLLGLWLVRETIIWLVAAGFLAFSIEPLVRMLQGEGGKRMGRGAATALAFTLIALVILVFALVVIPPVVDGARDLQDEIPAYVEKLQGTAASDALNADGAVETAGEVAEGTGNFFSRSGTLLDALGALVSGGFAVFMIFTFTLYFLVYGRDIVRRIEGRLAPHARGPFRRALHGTYDMNQGYWYGKFLIGVIAGLTTFATMKLLGLPYAAPLSIFVGITDRIPHIGATLGTIPVVLVGLLEEPWKGVVAGAVLILYQQVENNLITPKVFKRTVEIHPFISVVTVIAFTALFGIVGALVAVPVTKAIEMTIAAVQESRAARPALPAGDS
jgi:predicted PurR-regulated permease PerM